MFPYWLTIILIFGFIPRMCEASSRHIARRKEVPKGLHSKKMEPSTWTERFFLGKRNMFNRVADEAQKQGSFKIDDGKAIGGGTYEIIKDGVNLNMKIKITPDVQPPCVPAPSQHPTAAPSGQESTASPGGPTLCPTPAPSGNESTAPPGGPTLGPTAAPSGQESTAPPGGPTAGPNAAPSGPEVTNGIEEGSDIEKEALSLINQFRKIHDSPPMKLNAEMSKSAASYAIVVSKMGMNMQHSPREERNGEGENLSMGGSTNQGQTVKDAITKWYSEICYPGYSFGSESMGGAGHFTQLVWKESVELGFGKADGKLDGMKCTYYVARFKPAGNIIGQYGTNVLKGSFDPSHCNTFKQRSILGEHVDKPEKDNRKAIIL